MSDATDVDYNAVADRWEEVAERMEHGGWRRSYIDRALIERQPFSVWCEWTGRRLPEFWTKPRSRIPGAYWVVLLIVALLALGAVGYHSGVSGTSRSPVMLAVAIAFSMVIMVTVDLDRPGQGYINVSQQPMLDLRATFAEPKP